MIVFVVSSLVLVARAKLHISFTLNAFTFYNIHSDKGDMNFVQVQFSWHFEQKNPRIASTFSSQHSTRFSVVWCYFHSYWFVLEPKNVSLGTKGKSQEQQQQNACDST